MHYFNFNIGDYSTHAGHLSEMEDLAYRRLIEWQYLHEKPIPSDTKEAARKIRMVKYLTDVEQVLNEFFILDEGYINERCFSEIAEYQEKLKKASMAGVASGKARKEKRKQALIDKNGRSTDDEQPSNQPRTKNQEPITKVKDTKKPEHDFSSWPEKPSEQVFKDWVAMRNKKKHSTSQTVISSLGEKFTELKTHGYSVDDCLTIWLVGGWQGLKVEWVLNAGSKSSAPSGVVDEKSNAWEQLKAMIGKCPPDEYPKFNDPLIKSALFKVGTWMAFTKLTPQQQHFTYEANFKEAYNELKRGL